MRDSKRRARQWIADVRKTKTRSTGSTSQKTAVPKPPSQVLYILPSWEKPSDMEHVAVDCLIKAKSVRKGVTELGVHRQTLTDAMGRMRCAALPVTQCDISAICGTRMSQGFFDSSPPWDSVCG